LYRRRACKINASEEGKQFLAEFDARIVMLLNSEKDRTPFIFIENSSGMGKTQMAFNLLERARGDSNFPQVYYLLCCDATSDSLQDIYRPFGPLSQLFLSCAARDIQMLKEQSNGNVHQLLSQSVLPSYKLYTYGFLLALITKYV
jgi:hypothetical protein